MKVLLHSKGVSTHRLRTASLKGRLRGSPSLKMEPLQNILWAERHNLNNVTNFVTIKIAYFPSLCLLGLPFPCLEGPQTQGVRPLSIRHKVEAAWGLNQTQLFISYARTGLFYLIISNLIRLLEHLMSSVEFMIFVGLL